MKDAQFAELSVIGMKGCEAFAQQVDNYLKEWRRHTSEDTYLVEALCPDSVRARVRVLSTTQ